MPRRWNVQLSCATAALFIALTGCEHERPQTKPFEFVVRVTSEPGEPVSNAELTRDGKLLGKTGTDGIVQLSSPGNEGETILVDVHCEERLLSPAKPLAVLLRHLNEPRLLPRYEVTCSPRTRTLVVAIRAENGADLPVHRFGREVARTDRSGAALVALEIAPDEAVDLTLNTAQSPWLKPKDPTQRFQIGSADGPFIFSQSFQDARATPHRIRRRGGPIRIDSR